MYGYWWLATVLILLLLKGNAYKYLWQYTSYRALMIGSKVWRIATCPFWDSSVLCPLTSTLFTLRQDVSKTNSSYHTAESFC